MKSLKDSKRFLGKFRNYDFRRDMFENCIFEIIKRKVMFENCVFETAEESAMFENWVS